METERFTIGREADCDLVVDDDQISRHHVAIEKDGDRTVVRDLGSRNGTFVNGRRIAEPTPVGPSDEVRIGNTVIQASGPAGGASPTVAAPRPAETAAPPQAPAAPAEPAAPFGAGAAAPRSQTRLERITLQKSAKRATILAIVAILVALVAIAGGALFATGVLPPGDDEMTTAEIVEEVSPSTAIVRIAPPDGELVSNGTGWVLDAEEGLIVTNEHVVNGGNRFSVVLDGEEQRAELIGAAPCEDLAVSASRTRAGSRSSSSDLRTNYHSAIRCW